MICLKKQNKTMNQQFHIISLL